jgi:hypothetical protein
MANCQNFYRGAIRLIRSITPPGFIPIVFLSEHPVKPLDLDRLDLSLEKFLFQTGGQTCQGLMK